MWREDLIKRAHDIQKRAQTRVHLAAIGQLVGITAVSLFDGIACLAQALQKARVPVQRYEAVDNDSDGMGAPGIADHLNPATALHCRASWGSLMLPSPDADFLALMLIS